MLSTPIANAFYLAGISALFLMCQEPLAKMEIILTTMPML